MLPAHITNAHIDEAIRRIIHDGVPPDRSSRRYCLVTSGEHLPPKYAISVAHRVATGTELASRLFSGGQESNRFLRQRGFDVVECDCGGRAGPPTPGIRFPAIPTQSGDLVGYLRGYVASRLVIEGGFDPDWIRPRPPITVDRNRHGSFLSHDPDAAKPDRRILPGALKAARPDVTVTIPAIGPMLALSLEGTEDVAVTPGRVPEMTGRLERFAGACVNLHMIYPALVYGFWHVLGVSQVQDPVPVTLADPVGGPGDHGDRASRNGEFVAELRRYHDALARLSEREDIRDEPSRHEACALTLMEPSAGSQRGILNPNYPEPGSLLHYNRMFRRLLAVYDDRFVNSMTALSRTTERRVWHRDSPLLAEATVPDGVLAEMEPRVEEQPPLSARSGCE